MSNPILLAPGPVQLHPEVQKILAQPMIHHRTPEFDRILATALSGLKFLFETQEHVFMHTSTGSGAMESALVNLLSPGDSVLAIVSGKFGERWADMAEVFGAQVHRLQVPWGEAVEPEQVQKHLAQNPQTKLVLTQACETSTGTAHDIKILGKIVAATKTLLVVDGITAVGAYPIPMDEFKIDVLIAGSQKGIMLPTGLSFISLSKKAWSHVESAKTARFYFDLRKELKANKNGETLFSSPVNMIKALNFVLEDLQKKKLKQHFNEIKRRAEFTRALASEMGLTIFSKSPSDSVTALNLPKAISTEAGAKLRTHLEEKYQVTVMGGQDQAKGKIVRIGHMGYITDQNLIETMTRLAKGLNDFHHPLNAEKIQHACSEWLKANPV